MKFDKIKTEIYEMISDYYKFDSNNDFGNELVSYANEDIKHKQILRIKRKGIEVDSWKTIVLVEIEGECEIDIKIELKKTISWIASIKECLLGNEGTDLYLFLTFTSEVSIEECLRIESTEQFCRKYVLLPDEEIAEFVNRTFLQKLIYDTDTIEGKDPLERAYSKTAEQYSWLTSDMQNTWKKAFSELSGSDLFDALLKDEEVII